METKLCNSPFTHLVLASAFSSDVANIVLDLLEIADWRQVEGQAFLFDKLVGQEAATIILEKCNINAIFDETCKNFPSFSPNPSISFHRYNCGAGIGFHSDEEVSELRVVINFNRGWSIADGGIWILSDEKIAPSSYRYIPPIHNSGFVFGTSKHSFHAMTDVSGELYSMIVSFGH